MEEEQKGANFRECLESRVLVGGPIGIEKKKKKNKKKKRKMDGAELELERRSKFLNSLIQKKKAIEQQEQNEHLNVKVRASDMPLALQNKAFKCARDQLDYMPGKLD
ncbi:hypothetical protein Gorai_023127, partial [Gossypium raimondii]|nr:hypothetical protein [Gossypium raimondii]